jgi:hypothetical protein
MTADHNMDSCGTSSKNPRNPAVRQNVKKFANYFVDIICATVLYSPLMGEPLQECRGTGRAWLGDTLGQFFALYP